MMNILQEEDIIAVVATSGEVEEEEVGEVTEEVTETTITDITKPIQLNYQPCI